MKNKGNTDCFAYITSTKCKALNDVICKKEKRPFYKTKEQFKRMQERLKKEDTEQSRRVFK